MYGTDYLNDERQAQLVASIFVALPDTDAGLEIGDAILCEIIELGLADPDNAPAALETWRSIVDERITTPAGDREFTLCDDVEVFRRVIEAVAKGEDDQYGHCDTCGLPCDEHGCVMERDHEAAIPE